MRLIPFTDPRRGRPKPLGLPVGVPGAAVVGLSVADARRHVHVIGVTGSGKSTWLTHFAVAEAAAGRGVVLLDIQGDLARHVVDRLPADCADRLILLDPAETLAPPAWNPLSARPGTDAEVGAEWAAESVVGVFRRLTGRPKAAATARRSTGAR